MAGQVMRRDEVAELHYIAPIANVPSILQRGLLSHNQVATLPHESVAMAEVQDRRQRITLPTGLRLHVYVNLYFHARNPMMYKRKDAHETLCVLQISADVLDLPGVVITDRNAASYCQWLTPSPDGFALLDAAMIFALDWSMQYGNDFLAKRNHSAIKCAETLVPNRVGSAYVSGAYASCKKSAEEIASTCADVSGDDKRRSVFL